MKSSGISLHNVSFTYRDGTTALYEVTLNIQRGSFFGITGSNGSGKTTLVQLLNGLIPYHVEGALMGNITIDDINTRHHSVGFLARQVGVVFQNPEWMICNLTVEEEVAFGPKNMKLGEIKNRVYDALEAVGLREKSHVDPNTLSFGQKQKLAIACVLAMGTPYIVLDEPSAMLDYQSAVHVYELLQKLHAKGKTIITVEHDTDLLFSFADTICILNEGKCIVNDNTQQAFSNHVMLKKMGIKIPRRIER